MYSKIYEIIELEADETYLRMASDLTEILTFKYSGCVSQTDGQNREKGNMKFGVMTNDESW